MPRRGIVSFVCWFITDECKQLEIAEIALSAASPLTFDGTVLSMWSWLAPTRTGHPSSDSRVRHLSVFAGQSALDFPGRAGFQAEFSLSVRGCRVISVMTADGKRIQMNILQGGRFGPVNGRNSGAALLDGPGFRDR